MTELALFLLPLLAFVALAAVTAIVLRRAGRIVASTREVEGFRSSVRDLAARVDTSLDGAAGRIDAVRRGQAGPETIAATIEVAIDAVGKYAEEARALDGHGEAGDIREGIVNALERAGRALSMVDHGATILTSVRRGGRELEAQTSLKRGYLNLLHARSAVAAEAARAEQLEVIVEADGRPAVTVRGPRP